MSNSAVHSSYLQRRDYQSVAYAHFLVDVLNSSRSLLVAVLALALGLTNFQVGVVYLLYNVGNALSQPFFGRLADRVGPRWPVTGGVGWMIFFFGLAALAPPWPALLALSAAGLGSGAFHPTGTMVASEASVQRRTQATSLFFMAGQLGLFVGPIAAGVLIDRYGRPGYIMLPLLAITGLIAAWRWLTVRSRTVHMAHGPGFDAAAARRILLSRRALTLAIIILCTSTISLSAINLAPKLFTELGYPTTYVGLLTGIFMLGSAVGGVAGGYLADRTNGRVVILLATAASVLPVHFYIDAGDAGRLPLMVIAGFFVGMPHSVLVLMVQGLLPGRRATASGLALGYMFFSGSVGVLVVGYLADVAGLAQVLQATAVLAVLAFIATLLLPQDSGK